MQSTRTATSGLILCTASMTRELLPPRMFQLTSFIGLHSPSRQLSRHAYIRIVARRCGPQIDGPNNRARYSLIVVESTSGQGPRIDLSGGPVTLEPLDSLAAQL